MVAATSAVACSDKLWDIWNSLLSRAVVTPFVVSAVPANVTKSPLPYPPVVSITRTVVELAVVTMGSSAKVAVALRSGVMSLYSPPDSI